MTLLSEWSWPNRRPRAAASAAFWALSEDWRRFPNAITPTSRVANRERHKTQKTSMTPSSLLSCWLPGLATSDPGRRLIDTGWPGGLIGTAQHRGGGAGERNIERTRCGYVQAL